MKHKFTYTYVFQLFLVIVFLIYVGIFVKNQTKCYESSSINDFNTNWFYFDKEGNMISLTSPGIIDCEPGETITIYNTLPSDFCENMTLSFFTIHQWVNISIDNKDEIYSFGVNSDFNVRTPGNHWNFVEIDKNYAGRLISVSLKSEYKLNSGVIPSFEIGNKSVIITNLLVKNYPDLMMAIFLFICGLLFIFLYIFSHKYNAVKKNTLLLGFFSIALATWMATETQLLPWIYGHSYVFSQLAFLAIILTIYPFTEYIRLTFVFTKIEDKVLQLIGLFGQVLLFLNLFLHIFGIADLKETNKLVHLYIAVSLFILLIIVIVETIKRFRKGIKIKFSYMIAVIIVSIPIFLEIFQYNFGYISRISNSVFNSKFLAVVVIALLGVDSLKSSIALIKEGKNAEQIKQIAYCDALTGLKNRAAFDKEMKTKNDGDCSKYGIVVLDLNNLKYYNDEFGHETGDLYITSCADIMAKSFSKYGEVYRTGGDEFTIIVNGLSDEIFSSITNEIEEMVLPLNNSSYKKKMGISLGYCQFDKSCDFNLYNTMKRADNKMYIYKNSIKQAQNDNQDN